MTSSACIWLELKICFKKTKLSKIISNTFTLKIDFNNVYTFRNVNSLVKQHLHTQIIITVDKIKRTSRKLSKFSLIFLSHPKSHMLGCHKLSFMYTCLFINFSHSYQHLSLVIYQLNYMFYHQLYVYNCTKYVLLINLTRLSLLSHEILLNLQLLFYLEYIIYQIDHQ